MPVHQWLRGRQFHFSIAVRSPPLATENAQLVAAGRPVDNTRSRRFVPPSFGYVGEGKRTVSQMDTTLWAAVIGALITLGSIVLGWLMSNYQQRKKDKETSQALGANNGRPSRRVAHPEHARVDQA